MKEGQDAHLLRHRRVPVGARALAAPGGVPRQGLRGAAAHRPRRRGVGRRGAARSTGSRCVSVAKGEVDLGRRRTSSDERQGRSFAELLDVDGHRAGRRTSRRCGSRRGSPTRRRASSATRGDLTPTLEKMYRAMGQEPPKVKRILELNPKHPLVTGLRDGARRHGPTTPASPRPPSCCTAWRCSPRAASWPTRPRSSRSCPGSWSKRSRRRADPSARSRVAGTMRR